MRKSPYLCALLLSLITLAGCSSQPSRPASTRSELTAAERAQQESIKKSIYIQHRHWKGTRYRLGGSNKNGVDCSALVHITYLEQFGMAIPRTTKGQVTLGKEISRQALNPGDLIFFKTGRHTRHVGIYIEGDKFFHVSTKKGVTISSLSNPYWKKKYWHARRLQP